MPSFAVPIEKILKGERARKDLRDIESLALDMSSSKGQLHPIVVEEKADGTYLLLAGERRLEAAKLLGWQEIECTFKKDLTELERLEIELSENLYRKDFSWQEEVLAWANYHELRCKIFEAEEADHAKPRWTLRDTASERGISYGGLSEALVLAAGFKEFPELLHEKTRDKAEKQLKLLKRKAANVKLTAHEKEQLVENSYIKESFLKGMASIDTGHVNLCVTDLTNLTGEAKVEFCKELARTLANPGTAYLFVPLMDYTEIRAELQKYGLNIGQPCILHIKNEDTFFHWIWIAKGLAVPPKLLRNHYSYNRDTGYLHSLDKPTAFIFNLLEVSSGKGHFVLDPIAYSGKTVETAIKLGRNARGFCQQESLYTEAKKKMVEELLK